MRRLVFGVTRGSHLNGQSQIWFPRCDRAVAGFLGVTAPTGKDCPYRIGPPYKKTDPQVRIALTGLPVGLLFLYGVPIR